MQLQTQLPARFPEDWHHQFGAKLSPFPRSLSFGSPDLTYWPDLATFVEDSHSAQMLYVRARSSRFSISVIFEPESSTWYVLKYEDCDLLCAAAGHTYDEAVRAALSQPLTAAEMTELMTTSASE